MREGRTLTRTMQIETRQHELFNVDLGEGAPRAALVAGFLLVITWAGVLFLLLGAPTRVTFTLYVLPPSLLTIYGWRESPTNPRRRRVTDWALALRWIARGHRPVVALGRQPSAGRTRGLWQRCGERLGVEDLAALLMPWRAAAGTKGRTHANMPAGRPASLGGRVHLTGTTESERIMRAGMKKTAGKGQP